MKQVVALIALALVSCSANAGEVGFVEDFALAKDRAEALKKLIPGTEDYYYYHALHFLNTEQYEKVDALVKPWLERFVQPSTRHHRRGSQPADGARSEADCACYVACRFLRPLAESR